MPCSLYATTEGAELGEGESPERAGDDVPVWVWDATVAVATHGLLNPMSAIMGFAELLQQRWADIETHDRERYLGKIVDHARFVTGVLQDLARGLPPGATQVLDDLAEQSRRHHLED